MMMLRAALTVICAVALKRESAVDVARTMALPTLMPVTTPAALTPTTAGLSDVHTTVFASPASASTVAVSGCASPTRIAAALGEIWTPRTPSTCTVTVLETEPESARTVVVPVAFAVIVAVLPVALTVAMLTLSLVHVTVLLSVEPFASLTAATTVCVAPTADSETDVVESVTVAGGLPPSLLPLHAVNATSSALTLASDENQRRDTAMRVSIK